METTIRNEHQLIEGLSCTELDAIQKKVADRDAVIEQKEKKLCPL